MTRPRLLHVFKDYWPTPGGVERTIRALVRGCADAYDCTVLVNAAGSRTTVEYQDGATVIRAGTLGRVAMTPLSPSFLLALRRARADLVHLHFPNPPGELGYLALTPRTPMVLSYHNELVRPAWAVPLYRPWLRRTLRAARRVLVGDERTLAASPDLPAVRGRCTIVPYGVDLARLRPTDEVRALAARLRDGARGLVVLFVGRFRYYKGLDVLVRAMKRIDGTLLLVGGGPEEPRLRGLVRALGLADRVRFSGVVPERRLAAYYYAADVFVLPSTSRGESFGLAMAEAQACGVPTVCTELGTATSVVNRHGETGLVVRPGSVEALAEALATLGSDAALRARLGGRARELATRFASEPMVARTRAVYDEVLADEVLARA